MSTLTLGVAISIYYFLHSLLAAQSTKEFLQGRLVPEKYYRLVYNLISVLGVLPLIWIYRQMPREMIFVSSVFNLLPGGFLFATGLLLNVKALNQYDTREFMGIDRLNDLSADQPQELVTTGLNNLVRHPLYLAALMVFWGAFLLIPDNAVLTIAAISTVYLLIGIQLEERKLIRQFGEAYREYKRKVPMVIPKIN